MAKNYNLVGSSLVIMLGSSFLFGYNIGVLNQPVDHIRSFFNETLNNRGISNETSHSSGREHSSSSYNTFLWSLTVTILYPAGMIGAISAGYLADKLGRRGASMVSQLPAISGSILCTVCVMAKSPELLIVGRFILGFNCGLGSQVTPMYLAEISSTSLRGAFGTAHQLFITIGCLVASILGLQEVLGNKNHWPYLLTINAGVSLCSLVFLPLISESPRYLKLIKKDHAGAEKALRFYQQKENVSQEMKEIENEGHDMEEVEHYSMKMLFTNRSLRMPLLIIVMMQITQQMSGIVAIFAYSVGIFRNAGVASEHLQYVVVGTNVINVIMTFIAVPLMDRVGRRPLLLCPMVVMNCILVVITISLNLQHHILWMSYLSVACIFGYIICFAIGLGPIPFLIGAELFCQGPRPRAMSIGGGIFWLSIIVISISFEFIMESLTTYTFLVFFGLMVIFTIFIYLKVPETKGKTFKEIESHFQRGRGNPAFEIS